MEETQGDIRKLLKRFGVQADEAIQAHLENVPEGGTLRLRITLEDLTDYGGTPTRGNLHLEVEGEVRH
jgi:hypothetical protein